MIDCQEAGNILLDGVVALGTDLQVILKVRNCPGRNGYRVPLTPFPGNVEKLLLEVKVA